ncbi:MAG: hypothetical protein LC642_00645 [Verrucomicrobiaceae bacterium]|nr:hypothetical protein [Verrucomicrobiaceae bacterium]
MDRSSRILARGCVLLAAGLLCGSCSFFSRQPPLPRKAAIESRNAADQEFSTLVQSADIIYYPSESVTLRARSEAAWKLLEALHRHGGSFALGWDSISGEQQVVLDEWSSRSASHGGAMPRLHLDAAPGEEENCHAFLRAASKRGAHVLALGRPSANIATQSSEEFAAARIADYFRQHSGEKILVFLRRTQLDRNHGVPRFVAQSTKARQMVLNPRPNSVRRGRLLARH